MRSLYLCTMDHSHSRQAHSGPEHILDLSADSTDNADNNFCLKVILCWIKFDYVGSSIKVKDYGFYV